MDEESVLIRLTRDQAFVLSHWLHEVMMRSDKLGGIVPDRAVWSGINAISGTLETTLPEVFLPDYARSLDEARQRLLDAAGGEEADEMPPKGPPAGDDTTG
ncbi:hypothetical protein ACFXEL_05565 [Streptomyces sp. NPDC059382]|uniref:hypothetical protein n=1 Tax=Streptomyces sp. NPDC059382 TaxID=3346816 RepID=UPI0036AB452B